MSWRPPWFGNYGGGTLATGTSTNPIPNLPATNTLNVGDIVILACYTSGDPTGAVDAGDGWNICTVDSGSGGLVMGWLLWGYAGNPAALLGITLPSSMTWSCAINSVREGYGGGGVGDFRNRMGLLYKVGPPNWATWSASASSRSMTLPELPLNYANCLMIAVAGYNNAGTAKTCGNFTSWTELLEIDNTSPGHEVMFYMSSLNTIASEFAGVMRSNGGGGGILITNSTCISVAGTGRCSIRCHIPIFPGVMLNRRFMDGRRIA